VDTNGAITAANPGNSTMSAFSRASTSLTVPSTTRIHSSSMNWKMTSLLPCRPPPSLLSSVPESNPRLYLPLLFPDLICIIYLWRSSNPRPLDLPQWTGFLRCAAMLPRQCAGLWHNSPCRPHRSRCSCRKWRGRRLALPWPPSKAGLRMTMCMLRPRCRLGSAPESNESSRRLSKDLEDSGPRRSWSERREPREIRMRLITGLEERLNSTCRNRGRR